MRKIETFFNRGGRRDRRDFLDRMTGFFRPRSHEDTEKNQIAKNKGQNWVVVLGLLKEIVNVPMLAKKQESFQVFG